MKLQALVLVEFVVLPALLRLGEEEGPNPALGVLLSRGGRARLVRS